jgi:hypothetical protein
VLRWRFDEGEFERCVQEGKMKVSRLIEVRLTESGGEWCPRCSTCLAPTTLTEDRTSRCNCVLQDTPPNVDIHLTKDRGKKSRDTVEDTLLQPQVFHHSHRETTRLFFMVVREGVTDA